MEPEINLRPAGLVGTEYAHAQASTLRVRFFKIGAFVDVSVRRVYVRLSSAFPLQEMFYEIYQRLRGPPVAIVC
jgi:hypothetical protein